MKTRITRRYLAGLVDGEGYISILPPYDLGRMHYKPTIKMALTDKSGYILFEIKELLGGHIYKRIFHNKNFNNAYCWEVSTFTTTKKVLDYIRPYLILKKEQAEIVNEFLKTKGRTLSADGTFTKINPQVLVKRQRLYNLVKELNKRGRATAETERERPAMQEEATVRTSEQSEEVNRNVNSAELVCV